jgi:hypothetical protein
MPRHERRASDGPAFTRRDGATSRLPAAASFHGEEEMRNIVTAVAEVRRYRAAHVAARA